MNDNFSFHATCHVGCFILEWQVLIVLKTWAFSLTLTLRVLWAQLRRSFISCQNHTPWWRFDMIRDSPRLRVLHLRLLLVLGQARFVPHFELDSVVASELPYR